MRYRVEVWALYWARIQWRHRILIVYHCGNLITYGLSFCANDFIHFIDGIGHQNRKNISYNWEISPNIANTTRAIKWKYSSDFVSYSNVLWSQINYCKPVDEKHLFKLKTPRILIARWYSLQPTTCKDFIQECLCLFTIAIDMVCLSMYSCW